MKRIFLIAALFALPALSAQAQVTSDQLVSAYQSRGYDRIEVTQGISQIKVEASKGNQKVEVIYDAATGEILKTETGSVQAGDDMRDGVRVRSKNRNFLKDGDDSGDDNGSDDDNGRDDDNGSDDNGSDDDNGHDDDNGSDDDNGHDDDNDSGDDNGSDDDNGGDDDSNDD